MLSRIETVSRGYRALVSFWIQRHRVRETGGVSSPSYRGTIGSEDQLFDAYMFNRFPDDVENSDVRKRVNCYQQLRTSFYEGDFYHDLTLAQQKMKFSAGADLSLKPMHKALLLGSPAPSVHHIKKRLTYWTVHNELGYKGSWQDLRYRFYYDHSYTHVSEKRRKKTHTTSVSALGCQGRQSWNAEKNTLQLQALCALDRTYRAGLTYATPFFTVTCQQIRHQPTHAAQHYQGIARRWDNRFVPPTATHLAVQLPAYLSAPLLTSKLRCTRVDRAVYFKSSASQDASSQPDPSVVSMPVQSSSCAYVMAGEVSLDWSFASHWMWESQVTASRSAGPDADVFRMPAFLYTGKVYYTTRSSTGDGELTTGLHLHCQSGYKADGYDPVVQQFYVQDAFVTYAYPVWDVFLNFRIDHFRAFVKLSHINEYVPPGSYFVTPFYPGQKQSLDIGVDWSFFD